ncbi:hypothetical protein GCM10008905_28220 [Clostridium malenominatum]|uniref:Uncharacterized protein n=1 Tax=Clostridium malenominatum TaxID=1539 RepID=A0ABN1J4V6_9CLOT
MSILFITLFINSFILGEKSLLSLWNFQSLPKNIYRNNPIGGNKTITKSHAMVFSGRFLSSKTIIITDNVFTNINVDKKTPILLKIIKPPYIINKYIFIL